MNWTGGTRWVLAACALAGALAATLATLLIWLLLSNPTTAAAAFGSRDGGELMALVAEGFERLWRTLLRFL